VVFRFWVVILAFVGIQLAWNFRPFLGDRGQPYELFREYEGNFYTALIYSAEQLIGGRDKTPDMKREVIVTDDAAVNDSLYNEIFHGE